MKKLMIALSAATVVALGAKAAPIGSTVTFTDYDKDVIYVDAINGSDTGPQWKGDAGESSIVAVEGNKYLKVDTTNPLQRTINPFTVEGEGEDKKYTEKPEEIPGNNGNITISSKVQFTAADEAPTAGDGDKLLVWMQAADAEKEIAAGVMVTDGNGATMIKEVADEDVETFTAAWHTLEIKAVAAGTPAEPTAAFTITLDGQAIDGTFASLVTGGKTAQTIASIGFKGTGAVDDIAFAYTEGEVIPDVTVTVAAEDGVVVYTDEEYSVPYTAAFKVPAGTEVKLYVADDDAVYTKVEASIGTVGEYDANNCVWPITYTTVDTVLAPTITITVTTGGGDTPSVNPAEGGTEVVVTAADKATAEAAGLAAIVVPTGLDAATYQGYFKATAVAGQTEGTWKVTVELDPAKVPHEVKVDEALDIAGGVIRVESKVGLYYSLIKGTTVNAITAVVTTVPGDGSVISLTDTDEEKGAAAFYKIGVSAVAPVTPPVTTED